MTARLSRTDAIAEWEQCREQRDAAEAALREWKAAKNTWHQSGNVEHGRRLARAETDADRVLTAADRREGRG